MGLGQDASRAEALARTVVVLATAAHTAAIVAVAGRLDRVVGVVRPAPGDWSRNQLAVVGALALAAGAMAWLRARSAAEGPRRAALAGATGLALGDLVAALAVFFQSLAALAGGAAVTGAATGWALGVGVRRAGWIAASAGVILGAIAGLRLAERFTTLASSGSWESLVALAVLSLALIGLPGWMLPQRQSM